MAHVRTAINSGFTHAELASANDSEMLKLYNSSDLSPKLLECSSSATENYMASISCFLRAVPYLDQIDDRSGKMVREEINRMLLRLEEVEKIKIEICKDSPNGSNVKALEAELIKEGIIRQHDKPRQKSIVSILDLPVGTSVLVEVDGVQQSGIIEGKQLKMDNVYFVRFEDNSWDEYVPTERIQLKQTKDAQFSTSTSSLRTRVVKEIVETEQSYIKGLTDLMNYFYKPLMYPAMWGGMRKESAFTTTVLSTEEAKQIFGNIEEIFGTNLMFLNALQERWNNWNDNQCLGDIFLRFAHFFKMYTGFSNGYIEGTKLAANLSTTRSSFMSVIARAEDSGIMDLQSLLITPVQRIPRYKLLLMELLKRTPPSHSDYTLIKNALAAISTVADHIDETLKKCENQAQTLSISSKFVPALTDLIQPHRVYYFTNKLKKISSKGVRKEYQFWLFNDIVVYAKRIPLKKKYKLQRILQIAGMQMEDNKKHSFCIATNEKMLTLVAENPQIHTKWVNAIGSIAESQVVIEQGKRNSIKNAAIVQSKIGQLSLQNIKSKLRRKSAEKAKNNEEEAGEVSTMTKEVHTNEVILIENVKGADAFAAEGNGLLRNNATVSICSSDATAATIGDGNGLFTNNATASICSSDATAATIGDGNGLLTNNTTESVSSPDAPKLEHKNISQIPSEIITPFNETKVDIEMENGWVEVKDGDASSYYYNESLGLTSWDLPTCCFRKVKAKYSYVAEQDGDISFEQGEVLYAEYDRSTDPKDLETLDWLTLRNLNSEIGSGPANHLDFA